MTKYICVLALYSIFNSSCKKLVEIDPPASDLVRETVFNNDETACRSILGVYSILTNGLSFASGGFSSFSYLASLSADELLTTNSGYQLPLAQFNRNELLPSNSFVESLWAQPYQIIYRVNAIIEGLDKSTVISEAVANQLKGEAKFIRAFCHFYLVNFWGEIPLVLTTNQETNSRVQKSSVPAVFNQIITDLLDAQLLLHDKYVGTNALPEANSANQNRVRPNKAVATALLARVYLYNNEWIKAENEATRIISNPAYALESVNNVFLKGSVETIWQLWSNNDNSQEGRFYEDVNSSGILTNLLFSSFENNDARLNNWIGTHTDGRKYPLKFKALTQNPVTEFSIVFRLAEQYLIRSEARANLNDFTGSEGDLNAVRNRAQLESVTQSNDKTILLAAIERERRHELFTEWGHRWLDLKRTQRINVVMSLGKPDTWKPTAALYPIPEAQISKSDLLQNVGY